MSRLQVVLWRLGAQRYGWYRRWLGGLWFQRFVAYPDGDTALRWYWAPRFAGQGRIVIVEDYRRLPAARFLS